MNDELDPQNPIHDMAKILPNELGQDESPTFEETDETPNID
jgi:hypothetical protein